MKPIYRLVVDENGREECTDFTAYGDAVAAFRKAENRRSVFSVALDKYNTDTFKLIERMHYQERET